MNRLEFLKKLGLGLAAAVTAPLVGPAVAKATKPLHWKLVTVWPSKFPILQAATQRFAQRVGQLSGGLLKIQVLSSGKLVSAPGVLKAVSEGKTEVGCSISSYWADEIPAAQWFASIPFGLNAQGMNAWLYSGGGMELWEEVYAPFNIVPRAVGNAGMRMGGWFNKPINSFNDLRGLKMRLPGLGGKVLARAGGVIVPVSGGDIYSALKNGRIDATDWLGPLHDLHIGLHRAAKYYYYPGWHEPGTCFEVLFNKEAYDALTDELKAALNSAAMETNLWSLSEFEARNAVALYQMITEHQVQLVKFPAEVLTHLRSLAMEVMENIASKDPMAQKVHEAFMAFKGVIGPWGMVSEKAYWDEIAARYTL